MKKHLLATISLFFVVSMTLRAQDESGVMTLANHKIIIQLTSDDTLVHKALMKQIANIQKAAPNASVEVVCHNNGIKLLHAAHTQQAEKIEEMKMRGVDFVACENTMSERKIKKEDLLPNIRTVPAGIIEIVMKQEQGWSYLKAGF